MENNNISDIASVNDIFEEFNYKNKKEDFEEVIDELVNEEKEEPIDFFDCCSFVVNDIQEQYRELFDFLENIKQGTTDNEKMTEEEINEINKIVDNEKLFLMDKLEEIKKFIQTTIILPGIDIINQSIIEN